MNMNTRGSRRNQFIVQPSDELYVVVDTTTGRTVSGRSHASRAEMYADELNVAAGRGVKALASALGCGEDDK